jgi:hypothetical protein
MQKSKELYKGLTPHMPNSSYIHNGQQLYTPVTDKFEGYS